MGSAGPSGPAAVWASGARRGAERGAEPGEARRGGQAAGCLAAAMPLPVQIRIPAGRWQLSAGGEPPSCSGRAGPAPPSPSPPSGQRVSSLPPGTCAAPGPLPGSCGPRCPWDTPGQPLGWLCGASGLSRAWEGGGGARRAASAVPGRGLFVWSGPGRKGEGGSWAGALSPGCGARRALRSGIYPCDRRQKKKKNKPKKAAAYGGNSYFTDAVWVIGVFYLVESTVLDLCVIVGVGWHVSEGGLLEKVAPTSTCFSFSGHVEEQI